MSASLDDGRTLILTREFIARIARPADYLDAVDGAFRALAAGNMRSLPVGHVAGEGGAFHAKAAATQHFVAIKINGNFPGNPQRCGLPTIQGCIMLANAANGRVLALMDSIEITAQRTAAASALAAHHLARPDSETIAFIGCGTQARYHLQAFVDMRWPRLRRVRCFDTDAESAGRLCTLADKHGLRADIAHSAGQASHDADIIITTTTARAPILQRADIAPGCFIAAVGADNPDKNEIAADLMAAARVVPDIAAQAESMGDLRAALACSAMQREQIHAELAQIVSGASAGRASAHEIFIFDSTGTAIEDLAAATMIHARASADPAVLRVALN